MLLVHKVKEGRVVDVNYEAQQIALELIDIVVMLSTPHFDVL